MSRVFYDHLIIIEEVEYLIRMSVEDYEEKEELWRLVDEMIHNRVLACIFDRLPKKNHTEFLDRFHSAPHDISHFDFLNSKTGEDIEEIIRNEIKSLSDEILIELKKTKE